MRALSLFVTTISCVFSLSVYAIDAAIGLYKPDPKVQDRAGKEKGDPYSPYLSIGHTWELPYVNLFSPRFAYIQNSRNSDDHYGSYKVETFVFLYDFLWKTASSENLFVRYGIGSFNQKISGSGGTVTVPNGSGTSTAYKAGAESKSSVGTFNLGLDYKMSASSDYLKDYGLTLEMFYFDPLSKKSYFAYQIGLVGYF